MAKRRFRPEDGLRLITATDPDLSPDGRRVAFVATRTDVERDRPDASIWVDASRRLRTRAPVHRGTGGQEPAVVAGRPLARVHFDHR